MQLLKMLPHAIIAVQFTKADGTERTMLCTTAPEHIPEDKVPTHEMPDNPEIHRVFDTEKQEWRSFRIDSVISILVKSNNGTYLAEYPDAVIEQVFNDENVELTKPEEQEPDIALSNV